MAARPSVINYPGHDHSLQLMESMTVYPQHNGEWQCDNCTEHQLNTSNPYHCYRCQYDVCVNCALPVEHARHPLHPLYWTNMRKIYPMYSGNWKCDGCGVTSDSILAYHCFPCGMDLCVDCFRGRSFPIHRHPLIPADAAGLYNNAAGWWACDCCKRQGAGTEINSRYSWHCSDCEFDCCQDCMQAITAPTVHQHSVQLTDPMILYEAYRGGWKCDRCNREFDAANLERDRGRPYHCPLCQFDVCHPCLREAIGIGGGDIPNDPSQNRVVVSSDVPRPAHQPPTEILDDDDEVDESLDEKDRCIVCCSRPKKATIVHGNTGHVCCCMGCAYELQRRGDKCPICRAPIDKVIKHFNS